MTPQDMTDTEEEIRALWEAGEINSLLHLEGSTDGSYEQFLCDYFAQNVNPGDWVFASHRCHFTFLLYNWKTISDQCKNREDYSGYHAIFLDDYAKAAAKVVLVENVKRGRSMFAYGRRFICSAIVAGTASIAAGMALSIQRRGGTERVHCFIGDAGSEHGHFLESMFFAHAKKLPLKFIITDNNSSCGVSKETRRGSNDEIQWPSCVTKIEYQARFPHAGSSVRPNLKSQLPP